MKKYYRTLNKEERNEIKEIYKKEYKNSDLNVRLVRLVIYSVIGYITTAVIYADAFINKTGKVTSIVIATSLFIASTIFLISSILIKQKVLNQIALKNKKH